MSGFRVMGYTPFGYIRELPGIPTPRLIEVGGGEAYFVPNEHELSRERLPGVWYLRVDNEGYTDPDGKYTRVRIARMEEYP